MKNLTIALFLFFSSNIFAQLSENIDCEHKETITNWWAKSVGDTTCVHDWVYAIYEDLNETTNLVTAQYCPCGCGGSENQGRVCEKCKRNELRVRFWYYVWKPKKKSEYQKLIENQ